MENELVAYMISIAEIQKNSRDLHEQVRQVEALLKELSKNRLVRTDTHR